MSALALITYSLGITDEGQLYVQICIKTITVKCNTVLVLHLKLRR